MPINIVQLFRFMTSFQTHYMPTCYRASSTAMHTNGNANTWILSLKEKLWIDLLLEFDMFM